MHWKSGQNKLPQNHYTQRVSREGFQIIYFPWCEDSIFYSTHRQCHSHVPYLCPCFDPHKLTVEIFPPLFFFPSAKEELLKSTLYRAPCIYTRAPCVEHLHFVRNIMDFFIYSCSLILEEWAVSKVKY